MVLVAQEITFLCVSHRNTSRDKKSVNQAGRVVCECTKENTPAFL